MWLITKYYLKVVVARVERSAGLREANVQDTFAAALKEFRWLKRTRWSASATYGVFENRTIQTHIR